MSKKSQIAEKKKQAQPAKILLQVLTTILVLAFLFGAYNSMHSFCVNWNAYYFVAFFIFLTVMVVSSQPPIASLPFVIILAALVFSSVYIGCI
jgi:uncharacterized membrane protein